MRTMSIRRIALTVAATVALLSGCAEPGTGQATWEAAPAPSDNGVSALEPTEILKRSQAALKSAGSYRIKGEVDDDGKPLGLDLRISGADMAGKISMDGATVELLSVGGHQYIRPDEAFWTQNLGAGAGPEMAKLMGGKWGLVPAKDKSFAKLFEGASLDALFTQLHSLDKGDPKEVGGGPAIGLVDDGEDGGTLYVATTGEPYPVRLESTDGAKGALDIGEFGATFDDLVAPAEAEVIDMEQLGRR